MNCTHSGIEITQNNLFLAGNVADDGFKVLVDHVFVSGVADNVGAYTLIRVTGPVVEALGAATAWLNHSQQAVPHCKSYSVLSGLFRAIPLPEECVVPLLQGTRVFKSTHADKKEFC